ncbi:MAG: Gfo/Idh/MocA family oxidoreductase [Rhodospirillaceae bacterium]
MSEPLSVLIVGGGDIAGAYDERGGGGAVLTHAGAYVADGRFRVRACVEPDVARREQFMAQWGIAAGYDDLDACLAAESGFDVVSLCAPTHTHADTLERLLDADVRLVFAEKPLTGDVARSECIVHAYADSGRPIAVNYLRRWDTSIQALKREIAEGAWGRVQAVGGLYAKGLFNCASHFLDMVDYLIGPLTPKAVISRVDDGRDDDPTLSVLLETVAGAPAVLIGVDGKAFFPFELDLTMEKGRVTYEDLGCRMRRRSIRLHPLFPHQLTLDDGGWMDTGMAKAMVNAVSNIHDHLARGEPLASTASTAFQTEKLCAAIMAMAARGDKR